MADTTDTYGLQRHHRARTRLNAQHWLMHYFGWKHLVHPSISLDSTAKIADIGAGTGAWLLDVWRQSPNSMQFDGFDIVLTQNPPPQWLPENVSMTKLDIYEPLPSTLYGKYDLVNVCFFGLVVRDQDPSFVMEQLKKLVKPGGYIQWGDVDYWSWHIVKASPDLKATKSEQALITLKNVLSAYIGSEPGWAPQLPRYFEASQLDIIDFEQPSMPNEALSYCHDIVMGIMLEMAETMGGERGQEMRQLVKEFVEECESNNRGIAFGGNAVRIVGRLPKT